MDGTNKTNKFLALWIVIPTFFSYSAYFFPKALKAFLIAPAGLFTISMFFYLAFVFLRRPRIQSIPEMRYIVMLLVILCIGVLYTNAPNYGISKIFILYTWIILFLFYGLIIVNNFEIYAKASVFCGIIFVLLLFGKYGNPISFLQSMQGETLRLGIEEDTGMYGGLNPIWVGRYLGFIFLMALFIVKKKSRNLLLYGFMVILFLYMVASGSKGPIISLVGGCLILFANDKVSVNIRTIFLLILVFAALFFLLYAIDFFSTPFYINRFSRGSTSAVDREGLIELALNFSGILIFLFGTGTGNFGYVIKHADARFYPHNIVVELFYENGIISLIVLALMYISVIKCYRLIFKSRKLQMLCALVVYFVLNSMFSGDLLSNEYFFIFFILFHLEKLMMQKTEQLEMELEQLNPDTAGRLK